ncbi:MAG: Hint domain-containing protein [Paracoccus sp. (in: a-proteobacteria)]|uniref:Hint domain-containing protein n=1 Tax=Paracoccus sp. TaxID=267 RepID=UPI0026DF914A|nr:Hint domain-containing protein [Paracoccus sp. (in: a-proteobacteria)]MDO5620383.1 Hint domain-containing protein [Paracoccus sp. (in: a-proteobacteria)]
MAINQLYIYDKSSFTSNFEGLFDYSITRETGVGATGQTFSTGNKLSGVTAVINDSDNSFQDDISLGTTQKLQDALTINGTTYAAGTNIEMGFVANTWNSNDDLVRVYSIKVGNDIVGLAAANPETFTTAVGDWGRVDAGLTPNMTYTVKSVNNGNGAGTTTSYNRFMPPCFTTGTLIDTPTGAVAVETLRPGDLVLTRDHGAQPVRWIGTRKLTAADLAAAPEMHPIRIAAGALGNGTPSTDLLVSPQHRILVRSAIAQKMFGTDEVLVAAKQLCQIDGIDIAQDAAQVEYVHILFDQHEVVISNGAETESLYTGPEALKSIGSAARDEIFSLFPELRGHDYTPTSARPLPSGRLGRKLAVRHARNGKPLVV